MASLLSLARERLASTGGGGVVRGGLWENHRPEDLATPQAFARDPTLVWC